MKAQSKAATATKNFSFSLLALSFLLAASCQTSQKPQPTPRRFPEPTAPQPQPQPVQIPEANIPTPQATPPQEDFLHKQAPRVGLILGPGGMRAFAHVGVLKEFMRAKIPVDAIAGIEWGALFAGVYAQQGQVNDVEWKALQLKETDLPGRSWLAARMNPERINVLSNYLTGSVGNGLIEKTKVPFTCPTATDNKVILLSRGSLRDAIEKCLPYPPYFVANNGYLASPFAIEEAANYLRSKGAQLIIFVNVLSDGDIFPNQIVSEYYAENVLWSEARRQLSKTKIASVNVVIPVSTNGKSILDFDQRKFFIDAGSRAARDQVNNLVSQYGF